MLACLRPLLFVHICGAAFWRESVSSLSTRFQNSPRNSTRGDLSQQLSRASCQGEENKYRTSFYFFSGEKCMFARTVRSATTLMSTTTTRTSMCIVPPSTLLSGSNWFLDRKEIKQNRSKPNNCLSNSLWQELDLAWLELTKQLMELPVSNLVSKLLLLLLDS